MPITKNRSIRSFVAEAKQNRRFRQNRAKPTSKTTTKDSINELCNEPRQRHFGDRRGDKCGIKCAVGGRRRQYGEYKSQDRDSSTRNGASRIQNRVQKLPYGLRLHARQFCGVGLSQLTPRIF